VEAPAADATRGKAGSALSRRGTQLLDDGQHAEGQIDVLGDAVRHELELAVGRHKRDGAVLRRADGVETAAGWRRSGSAAEGARAV